MKGDYRDDNNPHPSTTMFSKFHHNQQPHYHQPQQTSSPSPPPPPQHFAITSHQFQLSNTSEEADSRSRSPSRTITPTPTNKDGSTAVNDGASIEVVKRPRGRPPGSKNKPKPPVVITREPDPSMAPYVLELPGGTDIVDAVTRYCRKRNMGLCVLTGSGTVDNISLRQPSTTPGATVTFRGRFDILSISATVFPSLSPSATLAPFANGFTISLAGPQGQIVGGAVVGRLMSAGPVYIIAASFNNPLYDRLPPEHEISGVGSGSAGPSTDHQSPPAGSGGGDSSGGRHHHTPTDSMSMYSSHMPSDVIWAPTPRQPSLHPAPY